MLLFCMKMTECSI